MNPAQVLLWRGYGVGPALAPGTHAVLAHGEIEAWSHPTDPRPTPEQIAEWAASPEYQEWHRTHGGDPAATLAREAAALSASTDPIPLATAAGLELVRRGTMDDRTCLAALVSAVGRIEAHLGLTPSAIEVPPTLTLDECEGLRRQIVAALLGLPPMQYEGG